MEPASIVRMSRRGEIQSKLLSTSSSIAYLVNDSGEDEIKCKCLTLYAGDDTVFLNLFGIITFFTNQTNKKTN